jgi:hypothetical protein
LRYLVSHLDAGRRPRRGLDVPAPTPPKRDPWLRYDNEALWTRLY